MNQQTCLINKKIQIIQFSLFTIISLISARLFYLQINLTQYLFARGQQNFLRLEDIESLRGNIRDCNGILLATNRPVHNLHWQGTGKAALTDEQHVTHSVEYNRQGLALLSQGFDALHIDYLPPVANFIMAKFNDAEAVYQHLYANGIMINPLRARE